MTAKMATIYDSILSRLERDFGGKPHFPICKTIQDSYYEPILDELGCEERFGKYLFEP